MPSTTTAGTALPTPHELDASGLALAQSFRRLEEIAVCLDIAHRAAADPGSVDFTIDDAAIGRLHRYLTDVDGELEQQLRTATGIRELVYQLDLDGRDIAAAARRRKQEANTDA